MHHTYLISLSSVRQRSICLNFRCAYCSFHRECIAFENISFCFSIQLTLHSIPSTFAFFIVFHYTYITLQVVLTCFEYNFPPGIFVRIFFCEQKRIIFHHHKLPVGCRMIFFRSNFSYFLFTLYVFTLW